MSVFNLVRSLFNVIALSSAIVSTSAANVDVLRPISPPPIPHFGIARLYGTPVLARSPSRVPIRLPSPRVTVTPVRTPRVTVTPVRTPRVPVTPVRVPSPRRPVPILASGKFRDSDVNEALKRSLESEKKEREAREEKEKRELEKVLAGSAREAAARAAEKRRLEEIERREKLEAARKEQEKKLEEERRIQERLRQERERKAKLRLEEEKKLEAARKEHLEKKENLKKSRLSFSTKKQPVVFTSSPDQINKMIAKKEIKNVRNEIVQYPLKKRLETIVMDSSSDYNIEFWSVSTGDDGSCLLHAIDGTWNPISQKLENRNGRNDFIKFLKNDYNTMKRIYDNNVPDSQLSVKDRELVEHVQMLLVTLKYGFDREGYARINNAIQNSKDNDELEQLRKQLNQIRYDSRDTLQLITALDQAFGPNQKWWTWDSDSKSQQNLKIFEKYVAIMTNPLNSHIWLSQAEAPFYFNQYGRNKKVEFVFPERGLKRHINDYKVQGKTLIKNEAGHYERVEVIKVPKYLV